MHAGQARAAYHLLLAGGLAIVTGGVCAVCLAVHIIAPAGMDVMARWPSVMWLHAAVLAAFLTIALGPARRRYADLYEALPRWGVRPVQVAFAYAIANLVLFAIQSHGGGPYVVDGQYVLSSHGRVLQVLTEQQGHHYRALLVRGFSGHWALFSLVPALL